MLHQHRAGDAGIWLKAAGCDDAEALGLQLSRATTSSAPVQGMPPAIVLAMPWARETAIPWADRHAEWEREACALLDLAEPAISCSARADLSKSRPIRRPWPCVDNGYAACAVCGKAFAARECGAFVPPREYSAPSLKASVLAWLAGRPRMNGSYRTLRPRSTPPPLDDRRRTTPLSRLYDRIGCSGGGGGCDAADAADAWDERISESETSTGSGM